MVSMCLLIVLAGLDEEYPILVAGNRDEFRHRTASPPGLFVGSRRRMISPRDRQAAGTWMAVNDAGFFAGLTNFGGLRAPPDASTRGDLPHLVLDGENIADGVRAIETGGRSYNPFQMLVSDGSVIHSITGDGGVIEHIEIEGGVAVASNEHRVGGLEIPGLEEVCAPGQPPEARIDLLKTILLDRGGSSGHPILKKGGDYGTVSSSLVAVHREDPRRLIWWYAAGESDDVPYRNYGNLGRRLLTGPD